ncbi:hypothetical protein AB0N14_39330 [Streptomyces sp. NPDC051104]|uniref:hypothetical protein n=1 Tax=Streptomyces sp. NPDC051104 TaxID=3155044 RepID=UPI00343E703C
MNTSAMDISGARELLISGLGRRGFLRAATAVTTAGTATALSAQGLAHAAEPAKTPGTAFPWIAPSAYTG